MCASKRDSATSPLRDQILESEVRMATHHSSLSPEEVLGRRATLAGRAVPLRAGAEQKLPHQEPILEPALANLGYHPQLTDQAKPPDTRAADAGSTRTIASATREMVSATRSLRKTRKG